MQGEEEIRHKTREADDRKTRDQERKAKGRRKAQDRKEGSQTKVNATPALRENPDHPGLKTRAHALPDPKGKDHLKVRRGLRANRDLPDRKTRDHVHRGQKARDRHKVPDRKGGHPAHHLLL